MLRRRRVLRAAALLAALFLVGEAVLRLSDSAARRRESALESRPRSYPVVADPALLWRFPRSSEVTVPGGPTFRTDEFGFRCDAPAGARRRILVVSDESAIGDALAWPSSLSRTLRLWAPKEAIAVRNASLPFASSWQGLAAASECLAAESYETVLVAVGRHDADKFPDGLGDATRAERLARRTGRGPSELFGLAAELLSRPTSAPAAAPRCTPAETESNLRTLARRAREKGARVSFVLLPGTREGGDASLAAVMTRVAAREGVSLLDVTTLAEDLPGLDPALLSAPTPPDSARASLLLGAAPQRRIADRVAESLAASGSVVADPERSSFNRGAFEHFCVGAGPITADGADALVFAASGGERCRVRLYRTLESEPTDFEFPIRAPASEVAMTVGRTAAGPRLFVLRKLAGRLAVFRLSATLDAEATRELTDDVQPNLGRAPAIACLDVDGDGLDEVVVVPGPARNLNSLWVLGSDFKESPGRPVLSGFPAAEDGRSLAIAGGRFDPRIPGERILSAPGPSVALDLPPSIGLIDAFGRYSVAASPFLPFSATSGVALAAGDFDHDSVDEGVALGARGSARVFRPSSTLDESPHWTVLTAFFPFGVRRHAGATGGLAVALLPPDDGIPAQIVVAVGEEQSTMLLRGDLSGGLFGSLQIP